VSILASSTGLRYGVPKSEIGARKSEGTGLDGRERSAIPRSAFALPRLAGCPRDCRSCVARSCPTAVQTQGILLTLGHAGEQETCPPQGRAGRPRMAVLPPGIPGSLEDREANLSRLARPRANFRQLVGACPQYYNRARLIMHVMARSRCLVLDLTPDIRDSCCPEVLVGTGMR
jgi:hypothetical protein